MVIAILHFEMWGGPRGMVSSLAHSFLMINSLAGWLPFERIPVSI